MEWVAIVTIKLEKISLRVYDKIYVYNWSDNHITVLRLWNVHLLRGYQHPRQHNVHAVSPYYIVAKDIQTSHPSTPPVA